MVTTARDQASLATATPSDVDREVFSCFTVEYENVSLHLEQNLQELAEAPHEVAAGDEDAFEESTLMHSVNGYVYGNGPVPVMKVGQRVRWSTCTLGTEVDLHTLHWHGNAVTSNGMRSDIWSFADHGLKAHSALLATACRRAGPASASMPPLLMEAAP